MRAESRMCGYVSTVRVLISSKARTTGRLLSMRSIFCRSMRVFSSGRSLLRSPPLRSVQTSSRHCHEHSFCSLIDRQNAAPVLNVGAGHRVVEAPLRRAVMDLEAGGLR
jgi:hypothetical protein